MLQSAPRPSILSFFRSLFGRTTMPKSVPEAQTVVLPTKLNVTEFDQPITTHQIGIVLEKFLLALKNQDCSESTIRNYRSDINQFALFSETSVLNDLLTKPKLLAFEKHQLEKGLRESSIKRKLSSITQLALWGQKQGLLPSRLEWLETLLKTGSLGPEEKIVKEAQKLALVEKLAAQTHQNGLKTTPKNVDSNPIPFWRWFNLALVLLLLIGLGVFGYRQFFSQVWQQYAFPSTPTRPSRILSFQGRLTDTAQNPITTSTSMRFFLYDSGPSTSGGNQLWDSGACSITPDQDGIFSTLLGSSCGSELDSNIFSENTSVWLQVQIASETLSPRQRIATVGYALNSETLQGYPISATGAATVNTVLVMDSAGDLVLGETGPEIRSISGTFTLEGQALTLETASGSNGNITLDPDGTGGVNILSNVDLTGYLRAPGATFSATYAGGVPLTVNGGPSGTANLTNWRNNSGTTLAYIDSAGNAVINQTLGIVADTDLLSLASNALTVNGSVTATGTINSSGGTLQTGGTDRISNGGNLQNIGTTQFNGVTYTWPGADGSSGYALTTNGSGTLSWAAASGLGTNYWRLTNGVFSPVNDTADLLIGGISTSSAKFRFLNVNTGTPVASVSANSGNIATYLTGDGTLATTNRQTLTIGNSSTYDTTGNIALNPNGTGRVGIGTSTPDTVLNVHTTGTSAVRITNTSSSDLLQFGDTDNNYDWSFFNGGTNSLALWNNNASTTPLSFRATDEIDIVNTGAAASTENSLDLTFTAGAGDGSDIYSAMRISATSANHAASSDKLYGINIANLSSGDAEGDETAIFVGTSWDNAFISSTGNIVFNENGDASSDFRVEGDTNTHLLFVDASADFIGIGTSTPIRPLQLTRSDSTAYSGGIANTAEQVIQNSNTTNNSFSSLAFSSVDSGGSYLQGGRIASVVTNHTDTAETAALTFATVISGSFDERMRIHTDGSIGINDITPDAKLNIQATTEQLRLDYDDSNFASFTVASDGEVALTTTGSDPDITLNPGTSGSLIFADLNCSGNTNGGALTADASGVISCTDDDSGAGGTSFWRLANGAISPINDTFDLLVGSNATTSAKFAVLNVNTGTPVASVSANSGNIATYLTGDGTLATTNRQTLTIGNSSTYNTTGNVLINPNGTGNVGIGTTAPATTLHITGTSTYPLITQNGNGRVYTGATGTEGLITSTNTTGGAYRALAFETKAGYTMYLNTSGNVGINTVTPGARLDVNGDVFAPIATFSANYAGGVALTAKGGPSGTANIFNIQDASSNNLAFFDSAGNLTFNAQNDMRLADSDSSNYIALQSPAVVGSNLTYTLPSTVTAGYIMQTDGSGTLSWVSPESATGYWRLANGALSPTNDTLDLLVGSNATTSAKFAVINVNTGTPVASVSANSGNIATYLTGDGTLATTNRNTITIGNSSTYNTSGNLLIHPNGTGRVGIGTTTPTQQFDLSSSGDTTLRVQTTAGSVLDFITGGNHNRIVSDDPLRINAQGAYSAYFYSTGIQGTEATTGTYHILTNTSSSTVPSYAFVSDTNTGVGRAGADILSLIAGGVNVLNADANGRVGIGTTTPGARLDVIGDLFAPTATFSANYAAGVALTAKGGPSGTGNILNIQNSSSSNLAFFDSAGNLTLNTQNDLRLADSDSSNYLALQAPATVGSNITYTLPGTVTDGYILQTDGSGTLSWVAVNANYWQLNNGALSPFSLTADINLGATASSSAKISLGGSLTRGKALAIFNQTEDQDIIAASHSGTTRFRIDQNGYVYGQRFTDIANSNYFYDGAATDTSLTLVGKTGLGTATPEHQLQVTGTNTGKSLVAINETGTNDIFTASASGATRFTIDNSGNVTAGTAATKDVEVNLYGDLVQQANVDLTAISNIADVYVYDTTKDSDGGKWTDDTTAKQLSWYTETKDDGHGDACLAGTDDRCGRGAFPKKAVIVATNTDVYIFDALSNTMWMRFTQTGGTFSLGADTNNNPSSVHALNGVIYVGTNGASATGLYEINFAQDKMFRYNATNRTDTGTSRITDRNTAVTYGNGDTRYALASATVNDVHAANINGTQFVALATSSHVNVVRPGAAKVINYSISGGTSYYSVWLTKTGRLYGLNTSSQVDKWRNIQNDVVSDTSGTADMSWASSTIPSTGTFSAPTNPAQGLFVDEGAALNGSDVIYFGFNTSLGGQSGLTAIHDVDGMETAGSVKHYSSTRVSEKIISDTDGFYPFDEQSGNISSYTSNGVSLTAAGSATYEESGVRTDAITFNGTDTQFHSNSSNFAYGTTPFYISIWFKHSTTISGTDTLIDRTYTTTPAIGDGFRIWMNSSGNMVFGIDDDATSFPEDSVTSTATYNDNQWHHLVAVKSGDQAPDAIRLYIDGEEAGPADIALSSTASISDSATFLAVGSDCSVGAACATGANFWDGTIDELSIGRITPDNGTSYMSLTQDQVRQMYVSGKQALKYRQIEVTNATTATSTTIGDSGETWTPNEFVGQFVTLSGVGGGQTRRIIQNTATVMTVSPAFTTTPDTTTDFTVYPHSLLLGQGGSPVPTSIAVSDGSNGQPRTLYIGTSSGSDHGSVTAFRLDGDYVTDLYHGSAGKTDDGGAAWDTTTDYDDIMAISAHSGVLAIGATGQYWQEYDAKSLTEKIDDLTNKTNAASTALASTLTTNHTQQNGVDSTVGYQVMRKGWGSIVAAAAANYSETVSFGITYDEIPLIFTAYSGRVLGDTPPTSLEDCGSGTSGGRGTTVEDAARNNFTLRMFTSAGGADTAGLDFCYNWMAIGTYSQGAASTPFAGSSPWANGADLAEWYATDDTSLAAGEIVSIDKSGQIKVVRSNESYDPAAIGIIATQPALTLGPDSGLTPGYKEDEFSPSGKAVQVALAGRVPVKVTLEGGPIKAGDSLTSSSTPGYAMKATGAGPIIGKAMDDFDGSSTITAFASQDATTSADLANDPTLTAQTGLEAVANDPAMAELAQGRGVVMAFVNTSWYDPDPLLKDSKDFTIKSYINDQLETIHELYKKLETGVEDTVTRIGAFAEIVVANLKAGRISTQELTADSTTTNSLSTDLISPLASGSGNVTIDLRPSNNSTNGSGPSKLGQLLLEGNLQVNGDATIAGQLSAENLTAQTATFDQLNVATLSAQTITGLDETIDQKLASNSSRLAQLENHLTELETIKAQTAALVTATESGSMFASNMEDFETKLATALEEPSLLGKLMDSFQKQTTPGGSPVNTTPTTTGADQQSPTTIDSPWSATESATLRRSLAELNLSTEDVVLTPDAAFINTYFEVNDNAFIGNSLEVAHHAKVGQSLAVGQQLTVGTSLMITGNAIAFDADRVPDQTLYIQASGRGSINFLNNLLVLNESGTVELLGNLNVAGNVTVGDTLLTNLLQPTDFAEPMQIKLATQSGDITTQSRLELVNELGTPVATIAATGKASFSGGLSVGSEVLGATTEEVTANQSSGRATILANTTQLSIKTTQLTPNSLIYITPVGSTANQVLYVKSQVADNPETPELEGVFIVGFDQPVNQDVQFNWWIVN